MLIMQFAANLAKISILSYRNTRFRHYMGKKSHPHANWPHAKVRSRYVFGSVNYFGRRIKRMKQKHPRPRLSADASLNSKL